MIQWFLTAEYELWKIRRATNCGSSYFEQINFQGRDELIFQSMSPNEFGEVPHTVGCKISLGTLC